MNSGVGMSIEVREAGKEELKNWDTYVEASPYGTIFHTRDWLNIVAKHTASTLYPLIGLKGNEVIGVFPIFYKRKGPLKMVFSPPPQTAIPYMGPILLGYDHLHQFKKDSLVLEFYTQVDECIKKLKPHYTSFSFPPGLNDCRPFQWLGYQIEPMYNYVLDISTELTYLESHFTYRTRKSIERAEKKGISIEFGSQHELQMLYDMLSNRYTDQGLILRLPYQYLLDLYEHFYPENLKVFTLVYHDTIIGGVIKLCYKDRVLDWVGHPKTTVSGAGDFLHKETMKWSVENGYHHYEFIGANTCFICQFKSKFNPALDVHFVMRKATISGFLGEKVYTKLKDHLRM
jgi:lipid II:glycine glycyltransferase (peptidoglycan interpeptide bridge formation enzyme)